MLHRAHILQFVLLLASWHLLDIAHGELNLAMHAHIELHVQYRGWHEILHPRTAGMTTCKYQATIAYALKVVRCGFPPSTLHGCCWDAFYMFACCSSVGNPHLTAKISIFASLPTSAMTTPLLLPSAKSLGSQGHAFDGRPGKGLPGL